MRSTHAKLKQDLQQAQQAEHATASLKEQLAATAAAKEKEIAALKDEMARRARERDRELAALSAQATAKPAPEADPVEAEALSQVRQEVTHLEADLASSRAEFAALSQENERLKKSENDKLAALARLREENDVRLRQAREAGEAARQDLATSLAALAEERQTQDPLPRQRAFPETTNAKVTPIQHVSALREAMPRAPEGRSGVPAVGIVAEASREGSSVEDGELPGSREGMEPQWWLRDRARRAEAEAGLARLQEMARSARGRAEAAHREADRLQTRGGTMQARYGAEEAQRRPNSGQRGEDLGVAAAVDVARDFEVVDTNQDGVIDRAEYEAWSQQRRWGLQAEARQAKPQAQPVETSNETIHGETTRSLESPTSNPTPFLFGSGLVGSVRTRTPIAPRGEPNATPQPLPTGPSTTTALNSSNAFPPPLSPAFPSSFPTPPQAHCWLHLFALATSPEPRAASPPLRG